MFGSFELKYRFRGVFISYLDRLWLGCIPKISLRLCLEVPEKFVWVVGGWCWGVVVVESKFSDRLWLSVSLALAKPNKRCDNMGQSS